MIVGYNIGGEFNNSYMFNSDDSNLPICKRCGYVTNFDYISSLFILNKKIYDISYTYDGRVIVSLKFKEFCLRNKYEGIEFKKLPNDPNYFLLSVYNIIKFDTDKRKLNFENYCDECKRYESITPARPIILKNISNPIKGGVYATDIHFASGNEKRPLLIIGIDTYQKMKKEKFKGIYYFKIENPQSLPLTAENPPSGTACNSA
jgi:hypothetical protein